MRQINTRGAASCRTHERHVRHPLREHPTQGCRWVFAYGRQERTLRDWIPRRDHVNVQRPGESTIASCVACSPNSGGLPARFRYSFRLLHPASTCSAHWTLVRPGSGGTTAPCPPGCAPASVRPAVWRGTYCNTPTTAARAFLVHVAARPGAALRCVAGPVGPRVVRNIDDDRRLAKPATLQTMVPVRNDNCASRWSHVDRCELS